ncbi:tyrosine-type recombinase/integrase [Mycobacterium sp.]|uniref:tyrosine-type recombinase/integrase n=1 Tax=Mycobacterium sp. TaxID=1785 RepID=UPI003F96830F
MAGKPGRRGWGKLRELPSGRWHASYIWPPELDRHNAPITYSSKMDAEAWLASERRLIEQGTWTAPRLRVEASLNRGKTLGQYASDWIETRNVKPRTKIGYESLLKGHIEKKLGNQPLSTLTSDTIRRWYSGLGKEYVRRNSHAYGLLHAILATAVSDGVLTTNPANLKGVMNPPAKRRAVILDVDDIGKLANAVQPERLKALVLVSAWCGLRWGEVIELRRKDIGPGCEVINVSRGVTHRKKQCLIDTPKSGKGRTVVVPPHIRDDLKNHLELYVEKDAGAQLFPAAKGGCHFNDRVFCDHFAPALKAIGRENVRIHDLRHFAGSQTARVSNLVETMQRLGHSTAKASLNYQQMLSGRDVEVAEALSALATSKKAQELVAAADEAEAGMT